MCTSQKNVNYVKELDENFGKCSVNNNVYNNVNSTKDEYILGVVDEFSRTKNCDWYEKLKINISKYLMVKLDTGAQCNVLPYTKFKQLNLKENCLIVSNVNLSNYNGTKIDVVGKCKLWCETVKGEKQQIEFQVVKCNSNVPAVLGLPTVQKLNLVQRVDLLKSGSELFPYPLDEYKDLFAGMGTITGYTYDIKLKQDSIGKIEPCRRVPLSLMEPLKKELVKMENLDVIKKVYNPTEFVNSLVIVRKPNGNLRVCLDPQWLNQNILREHFYIPTFEEITSKMYGAKIFSILDADKAFWQVKLSESSAELTTFNTPFGRYCFKKMPYGICSAPEVFHRCFSEIFGDIEGVELYIDDLLIWGKNQMEHDLRLKQVLNRARERNVRFNLEKCKIGVNEVKYMGHKFSENGLEVDDEKIKAIVNMKTPKNVKELETFLGMITYVSRFIPNVSQMTAKLRELLKKEILWQWEAEHEKDFVKLKKVLASKPVLQYFDINKDIVLSVDASQDGLGAVLLQNNLPVAYASKSLTETQKNYAQIEKETLAIVFGCEKFHKFLFGKFFVVESDHKPLETIFKKSLSKSPVRLQRMRIRLQPYSFEIKYKPGKELLLADALSRSYLNDKTDMLEGEIEAHVGMVTETLPMTNEKMKIFQTETKNDEEMQMLMKLIKDGWPMDKSTLPDVVKPYFHFKEELSIVKGLILKNSCIVVPRSLRKEMLKRIHYSHLGVEKCKNKAREIIYWPGMSKEIEDLVLNCYTCLSFQKLNTKEPLMPKEVPDGPWEVLGTDLFSFQGNDFLIVIDYFSKYVEIAMLKEISSLATIKLLKTFFSRFGIPKTVYSDNGPQYDCIQYRNFAKSWGFNIKTSSPRFAQSNGMVERHLQTAKNMLLKAEFEGNDPYLALLEYRNTPIAADLPSPSELMFGRKIKGIMPIKEDFFPEGKYKEVKEKLMMRQDIQKKYYDRHVKPLKPLKDDELVMIDFHHKGPKIPAKVIGKAARPRSYKLLKEDGRITERNRKDILRGSQNMHFKIQRDYVPESRDDDPGMQEDTLGNDDGTKQSKTVLNPISPGKAMQTPSPVQQTNQIGQNCEKNHPLTGLILEQST